jgi:exodeoxyribonuclease V beta subunit
MQGSAQYPPFDAATTPIGNGCTLLEASAGTGKTFAITRVVLRLLLEGRVRSIDRVLVVTFTKAATEELALRIRSVLRDAVRVLAGDDDGVDKDLRQICEGRDTRARERVEQALRDVDTAQVLTLHSFCKSVLEDSAFESGMQFGVELATDVSELVEQVALDHWRRMLLEAGEDAWLPRLALLDGWGPGDFVKEWGKVRTRRDWVLAPEPMPVDAAERAWVAAVEELRGTLTEEFLAKFERAPAKADLAKIGGLALHAQRLRDLASGVGYLGVQTALLLGRKGAEEYIGKGRSKVDKAISADLMASEFLACCARLPAVAERWKHAVRAEFFGVLDRGYAAASARAGLLGFDDLLLELDAALSREAGAELVSKVRERFDAALIDEFQDTDPVQFSIVQRLFEGRILFLIGDPKQSIYEFRGADVFAYLEAKRLADESFGLASNWRSHPQLVEVLNHLFGNHPQPFVLPELAYAQVKAQREAKDLALADGSPELRWLWLPKYVPDGQDKAKAWSKGEARARLTSECAAEIARLLGEDPGLRPRYIAVLVRKGYEARPMQRALQARGVPSVLSKAEDVFASDEAEDLAVLLRAMLSPMRIEHVGAALATRLLGYDAAALTELQRDEERSLAQMEGFLARQEEWRERGLFYALERLFDEFELRARLLEHEDGERRVTNVLHLIELTHAAEQEQDLSPEGLVEWFGQQRRELNDLEESRQLRLERDEKSVKILTAHGSKGLEYEVVFCPFLWDGRLPEKGPVLVHDEERGVVFDFQCNALESEEGAQRRMQQFAERLAEDLRLVYVALTRAKRRCYVASGLIGDANQYGGSRFSGLAWLLHARDAVPASGQSLGEYVWQALEDARGIEADWGNQLAGLCSSAPHPIHVRTVDREDAPPEHRWEQPEKLAPDLKARQAELQWRQTEGWRIASFSSLSSQRSAAPAGGDGGLAEIPDHGEPELDLVEDAPAEGIFAFARGARPGDVLHGILEHVDLREPACEANAEIVRAALEKAGLDRPGAHRGALDPFEEVMGMIERVAETRVQALGFALGELDPARCWAEWQFWLPLRRGVPRRIATLYREHALDDEMRAYAGRLDGLSEQAFGGFLTGFVDLLFEHEGRWHVLDWKSNWLGNSPARYEQAALRRSMVEHDYLLQSLIYQVAIARHLRSRDAGLDLEQALGGSTYVFLRGLDDGGERGLFHERAPVELIEAMMAELFGGDERMRIGRGGSPAQVGDAGGSGDSKGDER